MAGADLMFYFLSAMVVISTVCVVMASNPIYSALSLALAMVSMGFIFFSSVRTS